ncbi:MAG: response regulator receiver (CheY-like) modulated diguanylate phosphodiesterase domain [Verrucomicrobiaceae bacterium]|nr:response regulator receiver (CheY-like) modulated diguanylate phosphodiesterase domain [Verrucomicrobiaceae bacterium]
MNKAAIRILVLDDEHFMQKMLAHMLATLGFSSVDTCDNGLSALEWVDAGDTTPQIILLDLHMPGMDGIQFVRKLVEHNFEGSLLLVSGEDERLLQMTQKLIEAHDIPVLGRLSKPVFLPELEAALEKWKPAFHPHHAAKKVYSAGELQAAIANRELINFYQPKVLVATGAVVSVEALVRWRHPKDGLIFPDQIIELAEENHLIDDLTRLVLVNAIKQIKAWQGEGLSLEVAVNISMDNLMSLSFADFVVDAAHAEQVAPQYILLEVTESRLMLDQRVPLETLTRLKLNRFRLSIDDFGTGHSSLTQLRNIRFDELKIDRSFVHNATQDKTSRAIYDISLGLGKKLGMEVVAEGVEDLDDWDLVRRSDCDLAQGYFIGRPMPAAELIEWIAEWKDRAQEWQHSP